MGEDDRRIARMTGQLERPDSWNDLTAGMTWQLEWPDSWNDLTAGMTWQLEWPDSWNDLTAGMTGQLEWPDSWNDLTAGMTWQLERPDSWNDRKARTTRKPELSENPDWSLRQYIDGRNVHFINRHRIPNYSDFGHFFQFSCQFLNNIWCAKKVGAFTSTIKRNSFASLCLLYIVQCTIYRLLLFLDWAERNKIFTGERYVQNDLPWPYPYYFLLLSTKAVSETRDR